MLQKINVLLEDINKAEKAFKDTKNKNEDEITSLIESSPWYRELKKECTGDYRCWVSILSHVSVVISYKLYKSPVKQSISISQNGIDDSRNYRVGRSEAATNTLNYLAMNFYEGFYFEEK